MVDRYTKGVLTVIAVALAVIAFREAVPQASALGEGCGRNSMSPCYVATPSSGFPQPLDVRVTNWP